MQHWAWMLLHPRSLSRESCDQISRKLRKLLAYTCGNSWIDFVKLHLRVLLLCHCLASTTPEDYIREKLGDKGTLSNRVKSYWSCVVKRKPTESERNKQKIPPFHFGFRKSHGIPEQLNSVVNFILEGFEAKEYSAK